MEVQIEGLQRCPSPPSAPGKTTRAITNPAAPGIAPYGKLAEFAATLKKGAHLQLVGELRTREYEKEYRSNKKKLTVKQRVCEIVLESILKLDRAGRQEEPAPDVDPTDHPA